MGQGEAPPSAPAGEAPMHPPRPNSRPSAAAGGRLFAPLRGDSRPGGWAVAKKDSWSLFCASQGSYYAALTASRPPMGQGEAPPSAAAGEAPMHPPRPNSRPSAPAGGRLFAPLRGDSRPGGWAVAKKDSWSLFCAGVTRRVTHSLTRSVSTTSARRPRRHVDGGPGHVAACQHAASPSSAVTYEPGRAPGRGAMLPAVNMPLSPWLRVASVAVASPTITS